jgi:hypothetical protein
MCEDRMSESSGDVDPTIVECPTCHAWVGWACEGRNYGYHAAGYHPARERAAARAAKGDPPLPKSV